MTIAEVSKKYEMYPEIRAESGIMMKIPAAGLN